jgi:hypothetical protein
MYVRRTAQLAWGPLKLNITKLEQRMGLQWVGRYFRYIRQTAKKARGFSEKSSKKANVAEECAQCEWMLGYFYTHTW